MKRTYLKYFFGILVIFGFFFVTNSLFCAEAKVGEEVLFSKPDTWNGENLKLVLVNSTDNSTLEVSPDTSATLKPIEGYYWNFLLPEKTNIYLFKIPNLEGKTYDKMYFSTSNARVDNINYHCNSVAYISDNALRFPYINSNNVLTFSKIKAQAISNNPDNTELKSNFDNAYNNLREYVEDSTSVSCYNDILLPISKISDLISKEDGILDQLKDKIDEANSVLKNDQYDEKSTNDLENAIKVGEDAYQNPDLYTNETIKQIIKDIDDAINNLIVIDTSYLEQLVEFAEDILKVKDIYTTDSVYNLIPIAEEAKEALKDKSNLTLSTVKNLESKLNDAIMNLKLDVSELEELIKRGDALNASEYTKDSYKVLKDAINDAKSFIENGNQDFEEYNKVLTNLKDAFDKLVKVDTEEKIENAGEISNNKIESSSNPSTGDVLPIVITVFSIFSISYIFLSRKKANITK